MCMCLCVSLCVCYRRLDQEECGNNKDKRLRTDESGSWIKRHREQGTRGATKKGSSGGG